MVVVRSKTQGTKKPQVATKNTVVEKVSVQKETQKKETAKVNNEVEKTDVKETPQPETTIDVVQADDKTSNPPEEIADEEQDVEEEEENLENVEQTQVEDDEEHEGDEQDEEAEEVEEDVEDDSSEKETDDFNFEEELQKKVTLDDGTEEFMYSRGPKYDNGLWPINCHICRFGNIANEEGLKNHINCRKHTRKLQIKMPREKYVTLYFQRPYSVFGLDKPIKILPGEFIEERKYKDRLLTANEKEEYQAEVQKLIEEEKVHEYNKKMPVMGLCYAAKVTDPRKSIYYCALCQTNVFGEAFQHFVGANHQAKYIIKHFPKLYDKVIRGLASVKVPTIQTRMVRNIFRALYQKIEESKGLRTMSFYKSDVFNNPKMRCINKLLGANHYNEKTIQIPFKEVSKLIDKSLKGTNFIKPDLVSLERNNKSRRAAVPPQSVDRKRVRENTPPRAKRALPPPHSNSAESPAKSRRQSDRFNDDARDWQRYRTMIGTVLDELDHVYEDYEKNPESHPDYNEEWRTFWHRRRKELERDNIDPRYYDFNKEWIPYWLRRLRELHAKDIVRRKFEMKRTLRLSYDRRSPSPIRQRRKPKRSPTPPARNSGNRNRYRGGNNTDDVARTPAEPLSVISVLRLLTALEDQLGSLGPKAVQLLSRAVVLEKNKQNTNELLLENDFQLFFLTSKEKLKGQLMANVVEPIKVQAVKKAVEDISEIFKLFEEYMNRRRSEQRSNEPRNTNNGNQYEGQSRNHYNGNNQFESYGHSSNQLKQQQNFQPPYGNMGGQEHGVWQRNASDYSPLHTAINSAGEHFSSVNNHKTGNYGMINNDRIGLSNDNLDALRSRTSLDAFRNNSSAFMRDNNIFSGRNAMGNRSDNFNRNMSQF